MSVPFDSNVDLTVEIAFDSNPLDSTQTFTDVSTYLRRFSINRGRATNLADFNPAAVTVVLDNTDNRFSPNQTTHYYDATNNRSKIQPLKRIRIKAAYGGSTYTLFMALLKAFLLTILHRDLMQKLNYNV